MGADRADETNVTQCAGQPVKLGYAPVRRERLGIRQLLQYRFKEGGLAGQSFGNLILAALNGIMPTFDQAVEGMSQVLAITGRILPVTTENVLLEAEFENGNTVLGESRICKAKKEQDCRIRCVRLLPENPPALQAALDAIAEAEMIIFAPGSLYTSIIPNLLVNGIVEAVRRSDALKVYACNIMTESGETEGYTVSDHIRALFRHSYAGLFDLCLTNNGTIPQAVLQRYGQQGAEMIFCDKEACEQLGVEIVSRSVATVENGCVRHNPGHLARELMALHAERTIRVVENDSSRYQQEK